MSRVFEPDGPEEIMYQGRIIELVQQPMRSGDKTLRFEWGQRAPGVRLLAINKDKQILLTKEHRYEHGDFDYRLPGGKLVDTLEEWHALGSDDAVANVAMQKAIEEAREEAGLDVASLQPIEVVPDGTTFKWDLHYFETRDFTEVDQELETGEDISTDWYSREEVLALVKDKKIGEGRTVYILMPYLLD